MHRLQISFTILNLYKKSCRGDLTQLFIRHCSVTRIFFNQVLLTSQGLVALRHKFRAHLFVGFNIFPRRINLLANSDSHVFQCNASIDQRVGITTKARLHLFGRRIVFSLRTQIGDFTFTNQGSLFGIFSRKLVTLQSFTFDRTLIGKLSKNTGRRLSRKTLLLRARSEDADCGLSPRLCDEQE